MKKVLYVMLLFVVLLTGCTADASENDSTEGLPKIKKIEYETYGLGGNDLSSAEIIYEIESSPEFPEKIKVYGVSAREYEFDSDELEDIVSFFNIPYDELEYDAGDESVKYVNLPYSFRLKDKYTVFYEKDHDYIEVTASDEELIAEADDIIQDLPYFDGEYVLSATAERVLYDGDNECVVRKTYTFRRVLDGIMVEGGGYYKIGFGHEGFCYLRQPYYDYEVIGEYEIISYEDACKELKSPQVFNTETGNIEADSVTKLEVKECNLVYGNEYSLGYDTVQPFYCFKGVAYCESGFSETFEAYIPALESKYFE